MATDFRALCAELLAHAERAQSVAAQGLWFGDEDDGLFAQARAALADGPAVSDDREPASVMDQVTTQLHRRATVLLIRKVIDQAIRDTASVHWRVADTGEQLVRATDLLAWAEHMEKQMEQLDD